MPAAAFDPAASIVIHSVDPTVVVDAGVLELLKPEQFLLVHRCVVTPTNDSLDETDKDGDLILSVRYNFQLRFSITAEVLQMGGLAQYHPGLALSTYGLNFINGERSYFGFPSQSTVAKMIYENPSLDLDAGALPRLTFDVVRKFDTLSPDITEDPDTGGEGDAGTLEWLASFGYEAYWIRTVTVRAYGVTMAAEYPFWQGLEDDAPSYDGTYAWIVYEADARPQVGFTTGGDSATGTDWIHANSITSAYDAAAGELAQTAYTTLLRAYLISNQGPPPLGGSYGDGHVWFGAPGTHVALIYTPAVYNESSELVTPAAHVVENYIGGWSDLAGFLTDNEQPDGKGYSAVYSFRYATWLLGPEDEPVVFPLP